MSKPDSKTQDMRRFLGVLNIAVELIISLGQWLALPVALILFLQWPLRDLIGAYSRQANDLGQLFFAFYVALSVTAATRARLHLSADMLARNYSDAMRLLLSRLGAALGLIPWAIFVLWTSRNWVWNSVAALEQFPDTYNPGYFLIKLALWLMAGLMLVEGLIELFQPSGRLQH